jgi:NAD(P)-dependent dehydrogenase (short-subunit alcohol dehydrogenase family)
MSRATVATWGKIDVLFSNAGNDGPIVPTTEYPEEIFDSIIATHVRGCFLGCKYVIPQMNDGGSIVITSSITGVKGVAGNCAYVAAKHALMGLMRGIAKEVAKRGIRVNTINPGPIDNEFMRTAERNMSGLLGRDAGGFLRPDDSARAPRQAGGDCARGPISCVRSQRLHQRLRADAGWRFMRVMKA